MLHVAVVGGSGFIGRHVVDAVAQNGHSPVIISRERAGSPRDVEHRICDVTESSSSVRGALAGCDAVINASSYVGENKALQSRVNIDGAAHVAGATSAAGVPLVHVSTAGVYGTLPFTGGAEGDYTVRPESPLSRSRAGGDAIAALAGASILRPLFITGAGDTHFFLPLLHAHVALGAWIDGGRARLSVASAELVAVAATAAMSRLLAGHSGEIVHVVPDRPVTVRELTSEVLVGWGALPKQSVTADEALVQLARLGVSERKVRQFANDYFISSHAMHRLVTDPSARAFVHSSDARTWYGSHPPRMRPTP